MAGEQLRLLDPAGEELGLAIADPENARLRVLVVPADGLATIDGAVVGLRVERAVGWRKALGLSGAYRLVHGAGDGLPGFACDVMGSVAIVYAYADGLRALGRQLADAIIGFAQLAGAVVKLRVRGGAETVEQDVVGAVPETLLASEAGTSYEIHPLGGLNFGLFTDMREQRARSRAIRRRQARAELVLVHRRARPRVRARRCRGGHQRRHLARRAGLGAG